MHSIARKTISDTRPGAPAVLHAAIDSIRAGIPQGSGWATYDFNTMTLGSRFQPIFSVTEQRCVAYEGLLSAANLSGQPLNPEAVFAMSANQQEELFLDWLCRALHLRNFKNLTDPDKMIFLNAYPEAAIEDPHHPDVFAQMIESYGMHPQNTVIEILETGVSDEAKLVDAVNLYRKLGCKIAIDDFGIGFSNFDRLWRLRPDFVKIDRSVIASSVREQHARLVLANMVKLIHDCGAKAIIEGVETRDEALVAIDVGADFLQGYYFARPGLTAATQPLSDRMFESLKGDAPTLIGAPFMSNENLALYSRALNLAILDLQRGATFAHATEAFRALPRVLRVYLATNDSDRTADDDQSRLVLDIISHAATARMKLPSGTALDQLKQVMQQALATPLKMHVIAPDQCAPTTNGHVTLSCAFEHDTRMVVLCGDLLDRRSSDRVWSATSNAQMMSGIDRADADGVEDETHTTHSHP